MLIESMASPQYPVDQGLEFFGGIPPRSGDEGFKQDTEVLPEAVLPFLDFRQPVRDGVIHDLAVKRANNEFAGVGAGGRAGPGLLAELFEVGRVEPETDEIVGHGVYRLLCFVYGDLCRVLLWHANC